ncbi:MAG: alcohol dehydrogenase catalytic domain-containing protein [bacterium]|nr:alcohol dehydrogenase catalytic domain-containing protein [bacterium]
MADTSLRQPPRTMTAAELSRDRTLRLARRSLPEPPSGWVVVRVAAAGVCGTELHFLEGLLDPGGQPRVLGHEVAGTVCDPATDAGVRGQRAAIYNVVNCRACRYCRSNRDRLCERSNGMIGFTVDGGFAEYVAVPEANLVPLPETVTFEAGAVLACSGMTAVHAVRLAGIGIGDPVVVNGVGGVGLMLIQVAALAGTAVLAVADDPAKLDLARSLGARAGILIDHPQGYEDLDRQARRLLGRAPDAFFETVGTRETMHAGFSCLAPAGAFIQIGYTSQPLDIHPGALIRNELRILTSAAGSKNDLETAIALAAQGQLKTVIANRTGLDGLEAAILSLKDRRVLGRNVVTLA